MRISYWSSDVCSSDLLCWFQRAFMFPLAIILGIAAFKSDRAVVPYGLALAAGGGLIALYHSLLYVGVIPAPNVPCTGDRTSVVEGKGVSGRLNLGGRRVI